MSDLVTIQDRLNAIADKKLRKAIVESIEPIQSLGVVAAPTPFKCEQGFVVRIDTVLHRLRDVLFDALKESWREKESAEFMAKVDSLGEQIDELRNEIER